MAVGHRGTIEILWVFTNDNNKNNNVGRKVFQFLLQSSKLSSVQQQFCQRSQWEQQEDEGRPHAATAGDIVPVRQPLPAAVPHEEVGEAPEQVPTRVQAPDRVVLIDVDLENEDCGCFSHTDTLQHVET